LTNASGLSRVPARCYARLARRGRTRWGSQDDNRGGTGIAGQGPSDRRLDGQAGLSAGITIVAAILLGAAVGLLVGWLLDAGVLLALIGAAVGIVFGFYVVYIRFIR
jgi:hypothetical protein